MWDTGDHREVKAPPAAETAANALDWAATVSCGLANALLEGKAYLVGKSIKNISHISEAVSQSPRTSLLRIATMCKTDSYKYKVNINIK